MPKKLSFILPLLLLLLAVKTHAQAGYDFPKPKGWNVEKLSIPIDFAKNIPYKGSEELRFTPGWGNSKTEEYWAYDFLWYIDGVPSLSKGNLDKYMASYFNGLYLSNLKNKPAPPASFTKARFKKVDAQMNDKQKFEGTINTLDFLTGQPITFNVKVHVRQYAKIQHTAVLIEVSPQDFKNVIWDSLDGVANGLQIK